MFLKMLFDGSKALALRNGAFEIFIELVAFFFVLVEEEGLEDDWGDKKKFTYAANESHIFKFIDQTWNILNFSIY